MAITNNDIKFLFYAKKLGVSFNSMLTLGRLNYYGSPAFLKAQIDYFNLSDIFFNEIDFKGGGGGYSEPQFIIFGAKITEEQTYENHTPQAAPFVP